MRFPHTRSNWLGNGALLVMGMLLASLTLGGAALAAPPPQAPAASNATITALQNAHGQNVGAALGFDITTTTQAPLPSQVFLNIFLPNGRSVTGGPVQVQPQASTTSGVYSIVYTVYNTVASILANVVGNIAGTVSSAGSVLYNVYLRVATPPPNGGGGGGGGAPPPPFVQNVSNTVSTLQSVNLGTTSQGTVQLDGATVNVTQVQLSTANLSQALSQLPTGTSDLTVTVPPGAVTSGEGVVFSIPAAFLSQVTTSGDGLTLQTPYGTLTLPPAALKQMAAQTGANGELTLQMVPLTQSQIQQLESSLPPGQASNLTSGGPVLDISASITGGGGQPVSFEPGSGATLDLSLPYDGQTVSGTQALQLGIYRYGGQSQGWQYVGGSTDVNSGTISTTLGHLSTYAVFVDTQTFPDIQGYWAQSDIDILLAHHIVTGVSATSFDPTGLVTRAEFAALITRALNLSAGSSAPSFSDVHASDWFASAVAAAAAAHIVQGYPDGTFRPNADVTRQDMAVMIARAMAAAGQPTQIATGQVGTLLAPFHDAGSVAAYARDDVAIAVQQKIMQGETATTLDPTANTTRAEAAVMIRRLLGYLGDL